jgi:cysteine-rich repeat protein
VFVYGGVLAHELGHILGASNHDGESNTCPSSGYVMEAVACALGTCTPPNQWSSCSTLQINEYLRQLSYSKSNCLYGKVDSTDANRDPQINETCGNGVIDTGEECDSGNTVSGSACCTADCKLKTGAVCEDSNGKCCSNCQFKSSTTKCSTALNECENDAYCSGTSGTCSLSLKADGTTCDGNGRCRSGACLTREAQCISVGYTYKASCDTSKACTLICYSSEHGSCFNIVDTDGAPIKVEDTLPCTVPSSSLTGKCKSGVCNNAITVIIPPYLTISMIILLLLLQ